MRASPLVSVLIPLYNKVQWVESTIQSALDQTYTNIEVVVIDDGSSDGSADVVRAMDDPRIRLVERENRGANATRNELLIQAKGEYVQHLDADDLLLPDKLELQVAGLEAGADVSLSPVWMDRIDGVQRPDTAELGSIETIIWHGIPTHGPLHRKASLTAVDGWTFGLAASQEYDLHLRLCLGGYWANSHIVSQPLSLVRSVPDSTSSVQNRLYQAKAETLLRVSELGQTCHHPALARALANTARNLARYGAIGDASKALTSARNLDPSSLGEFSHHLRWIKPQALLIRVEWLSARLHKVALQSLSAARRGFGRV